MPADSPFKDDACLGRVALVTGGASGIGLGIATRLGQHGAKLVLMGRRKEFLERAAAALRQQGIAVATVAGDVRSERDAQAAVNLAVNQFGKLDTLVNCAAGNFLSLAENLSTKGFSTVMEIDAIGTFNMCRQSLEALKESGQGVIINISATLHYSTTWYQTHACAAKAAIDSMTRQLALEWGLFNIRVNGVAPGPIEGTPGFVKLTGSDKGVQDKMVSEQVPLGRLGTVTDIGNACVFLCSSAASYISGDTLVVDGASWLYTIPMAPRAEVQAIAKRVEKESRATGGAKL